jgi:hypothetical protein
LQASSHAADQYPGHSPAPAHCRSSGADEAVVAMVVKAELGPRDADVCKEPTLEVN